jgi:uncharacterized membrane protein YgaE (UPF0421/DUF939 family)
VIGSVRSAGRGVGRGARHTLRPARLLLAAKSAIAAGIAWFVGHLLPNVDEYSYYAPLGALIVMMPTLMGSVRSTVQTILGLALGVALAWAVILSPLPGAVSVALAVGLGVIVAGISGLGAGSDYVPIAALFVLVVGGANPDEFSIGYLAQMGVGMLVGIVINVAVFPPLWLRESSESLASLRGRLADLLGELARSLGDATFERGTALDRIDDLERAVREAAPLVSDAAESRRFNVRARRHPHDIDEDFGDLAALDRLAAHTRTIIEDSDEATGADHGSDHFIEPISTVLQRLSDLVLVWDARDDDAEAIDDVDRAIAQLEQTVRANDETLRSGSASAAGKGVVFGTRRIVAIIRRRNAAVHGTDSSPGTTSNPPTRGVSTDPPGTLGP